MIPKTIHYCWFGNGTKNDVIEQCMSSWKSVMPDYHIIEWNESNSPMHLAYVQEMYKRELWSKVSNFVRLYALYNEGGIYLDTDVEVIKCFDPLLHDNCFLGFQKKRKKKNLNDWVNNAVIGTIPRHTFLQRCMELTIDGFTQAGKIYRSPEVTTEALLELGLRKYGKQMVQDIRLYPTEYFYPYPWWGHFHPACITHNTYCIHRWQLSWTETTSPQLRLRSWLYDKSNVVKYQFKHWRKLESRNYP